MNSGQKAFPLNLLLSNLFLLSQQLTSFITFFFIVTSIHPLDYVASGCLRGTPYLALLNLLILSGFCRQALVVYPESPNGT